MGQSTYIRDGFVSAGNAQVSGSLSVTGGITGSLHGTASYALTASYAPNLVISGSITNVDYIDFNTGSAEPAWKSGRVFWNDVEGCLLVYNSEADVTLQVGQESWVRVFNQTGVTITNGTAVRIVGSQGDVPKIVKAQAQQVSGSALGDNQIIGLATHDIETNSIGYVTTQGLTRGLNTNAFVNGDLLFVSSSAGLMTNVIPQAPFEVIQVGICVKAGPGASGIIFVFPTQPIDFGDLASAERGVYQYGDLWSYQLSGSVGVWKHGRQLSGSYAITGSLTATSFTGSLLGTASYAVSASYAPPTFPYTGSAIITGSLSVTGTVIAGFNPTPSTGSIKDGVTSVLGSLQDWNSKYYSGEVLYSEVAGETITFGQLCYRDRFGKWLKASAAVADVSAYNILGICLHTATGDTSTSILTKGYVATTYIAAGNMGDPIYVHALGASAGSMTATAPSTAGNVVRVVGHVFWDSASQTNGKWIISFNPDNTWIEL